TVLITLFVLLRHTALAEISTPSLHDALPISPTGQFGPDRGDGRGHVVERVRLPAGPTIFHQSHEHPGLGQGHSQGAGMGEARARSEEHTSELQSRFDLVCRLLLEKKNIYDLH